MAGDEENRSTENLNRALDDLSSVVGRTAAVFMTSTPTIKDALDIFGQFGTVGNLLKGVGGHLQNQMKMYRDLAHYGINFGNQLDQMTMAQVQTGLSTEQFTNILNKNSEMLAGGAATANQGATEFLRAVAQFRTATGTLAGEQVKYAEQLRRLGFDFEDLAENMAYMETLQNLSARRTFMNDTIRNQATFEFAEQLDILSKLTGQQSDQLRDEMAKRAREGDYQAFLAGLDPAEAQQIMAAQAQAEAAGFGDLFKDYMIRGFPSEDQRLIAGMSGEMVSLFEDMRAARQRGDMTGFNNLANGIMVTGSATQMANRDLAMLGNTTRSTAAAMSMFSNSSPAMAKYRQALIAEAEARGVSVDQLDRATRERIAAEALATAKAEQDAQQGDAGEGDSRAITNALVGIEDALVTAGTAVQREAVTRLYDGMLTPAAREFTAFLNDPSNANSLYGSIPFGMLPNGGATPSVANMPDLPENKYAEFMRDLSQQNPATALEIANLQSQLENATDPSEVERLQGELRDAITNALNNNVNLRSPFGATTPNVDDVTINATNAFINGQPVPMNNGTIGAFGSILNDFGKESLAALHGNEAVLNENQLTNLAKGLYNSGSQSSIQGLQGIVNTIRPQMQQLSAQMAPQMQSMAEKMTPMMEQLAESSRSTMQEMTNTMRGPLEQLASTSQQSMGIMNKQLRAQRALPGNLFQGIKI